MANDYNNQLWKSLKMSCFGSSNTTLFNVLRKIRGYLELGSSTEVKMAQEAVDALKWRMRAPLIEYPSIDEITNAQCMRFEHAFEVGVAVDRLQLLQLYRAGRLSADFNACMIKYAQIHEDETAKRRQRVADNMSEYSTTVLVDRYIDSKINSGGILICEQVGFAHVNSGYFQILKTDRKLLDPQTVDKINDEVEDNPFLDDLAKKCPGA